MVLRDTTVERHNRTHRLVNQMPARKTGRNTTRRDKHRRIIADGLPPSRFGKRPPCWHCGEPIDYDAHYTDPDAFVIDHLIPLSAGGEDVLDNIVPSHRRCNSDKGAKTNWRPGVHYVTERRW